MRKKSWAENFVRFIHASIHHMHVRRVRKQAVMVQWSRAGAMAPASPPNACSAVGNKSMVIRRLGSIRVVESIFWRRMMHCTEGEVRGERGGRASAFGDDVCTSDTKITVWERGH